MANTFDIIALVIDVIGLLTLLFFGFLLYFGLYLIPIPIVAIICGRLGIKKLQVWQKQE